MRSGYLNDLMLVIIFTLLSIPFILFPPLNETPIRIILGLPLILFFPGYALIAALFPAKGDLDPIERVALSFGLSIAVVPLIGLVLNYTPFGIRLMPILISLSGFTILLSIAATFRIKKLTAEERFSIEFVSNFRALKASFETEKRLDRILSVILILSIIAAIVMTIYVIVTPKEGEHFTEFYILGPNGTADEYPTDLMPGEEGMVIVGIVNHEYTNQTYRLEVKLNESLLHEESITLSHNETWESPFSFKIEKRGDNQRLEFLLYNESNSTEPYRSLHLWVDVSD
ncbi:MAG: Uncharacterized conserved protein UCP018671 [Candidatus Syntrophoarchaeum caldarius]|uniref:Uncharacterized conserved protein UCP018671 n=1 Tax=Candidatus Syntropharchaeum caldarium TaxID=1838285 RepID=A0A1F2PAH1_9EURY|nr:MAG: Uncharacterized conserved protein UCP018671 [Candidatus Syntrophoarchaeum caldarius]